MVASVRVPHCDVISVASKLISLWFRFDLMSDDGGDNGGLALQWSVESDVLDIHIWFSVWHTCMSDVVLMIVRAIYQIIWNIF